MELRWKNANSNEHAFNAAPVRLRHVLRHLGFAENAIGHLDNDVVGLEKAAVEVFGVATSLGDRDVDLAIRENEV
jgi:hypothetical protein